MAAVAGLAGALSFVAVALLTSPARHSVVLPLAFLAVFLTAELAPVHLTHQRESESLRLEEAILVPMVLLLSPLQTIGTVVLSVAVATTVSRRGWLKSVFNTGVMSVSTGAGLLVAALVGVDGTASGRSLSAAVAAGLVFCLTSAVCVACAISIAKGESMWVVLADGLFVRVATWVGSLSLGVLVAMATVEKPWALVVAVVPAVVLQYAYSVALRQLRERRQAEALYEAAGRIRGTVSSAHVRAELLSASRELLAVRSARVVEDLSEPVAAGALRVVLDDASAVEVTDPATGGQWTRDDMTRLRALAGVASGALENALLYEQLHAITRSLGEGVLALDTRGVVTFANPAAEDMLGWPQGALQGRDVAGSVDPSGRSSAGGAEWVHLPRLHRGETVRLEEHVVLRRDSTPLDVALTASPVRREGVVVGAVVVFRDVTERKALERRLVHQAFHDPLTGLPNRALFLDRLEHARARGHREGTAQAVLFVDVDRFKLINDSLGHRVGDEVLCTLAERIVGVLRPGDTVARFGGDEFTVLLEQVGGTQEAAAAAERIIRSLRLPVVAGDREVVLSVSIGIAVAEPGNAPGDLLAAADIAMYEAKSSGKDRYCIAAPDADDRALARLDLEMELRRAIAEHELELHYQPVVRADGSGLHGLEALVRWRHPTLGLLGPAHFMGLAEDTGLVLPLGDWVLEQACRAAKDWHDRHPATPVVMAVNLSARQFSQPDLCERVSDVLARTGVDPTWLALEITETVVMQDTSTTLEVLRALKALRVKLYVDDFGTGYSSLSYLKRFPVDAVKIDKSFVDGLDSGPVDREIVAAVIRLAAAVGMQTVAEGVETTAQLETLRMLGCTLVQGFLYARPQSLADVERLLLEAPPVLPPPRSAPGAGTSRAPALSRD